MIVIIGWAVVALGAAVSALVLALTGVRVAIRRRRRRDSRFRPLASQGMARYVTGVGPPPEPAGPAERQALRRVVMDTLPDLRGSERDLLVGLAERLGFVREAAIQLRSRRRSKRRRAAETLALVASATATSALEVAIADRDPLVRTSCARTLVGLGDESRVAEAVAVAQRDMRAVPGAASAVVLALARRWPDALVPLLGAGADQQVRLVAVRVAGRLRLAGLAPALRGCLSAGDDLAAAAAEGLGMIGDFDAVEPLLEVARDERRTSRTRAAAASALGAIGDPASVPDVEGLLLAEEWPIRSAAARSLALLGGDGAAALRRAAASDVPELREQAEAALAG